MTGTLSILAAAASVPAAASAAAPGALAWVVAIGLAAASFALAVAVFRLPRVTWTSLAAALVFGLAGYTLQASPDIAAAPRSLAVENFSDDWMIEDTRRILVGEELRSRDPAMTTGNAFARRGRFTDASGFFRHALQNNPADFDAWVALGNALTEQADGNLTQGAVYAYREANRLQPANPAPSYFLGLALIRQGRLMEARQVWRSALEDMGESTGGGEGDTQARAFMVDRVERLDSMLGQIQQSNGMESAVPAADAPSQVPETGGES